MKALFRYLQEEGISINRKEFQFQYESHPEFPSLLALSDTLSFFNITNGALQVTLQHISQLPKVFLTKLKNHQNDLLTLVETKASNKQYHIYNEAVDTIISKSDLAEKWEGIVFLAEKNTENRKAIQKKYIFKVFGVALLISFLIMLWQHVSNYHAVLFLLLPLLGLLFSIMALKDTFAMNATLLTSFCTNETADSCQSVIHSKKWPFLKQLNFSDLSIIFFSFQLFSSIISIFSDTVQFFYAIQLFLVIASIPLLGLSVYYQKFVVKSWCKICLAIASIIMIELFFLLQISDLDIVASGSFQLYNLYAFIFLIITLSWLRLQRLLQERNALQKEMITANRFRRDYSIFKTQLLSQATYHFPKTPLILGNEKATLTIHFVTNPFCGYCETPFLMLTELLKHYENNINIQLYFNFDVDKNHQKNTTFVQHLIHIQQTLGSTHFVNALKEWYKEKDLDKWLHTHAQVGDLWKINQMLRTHRAYLVRHKLTFTPFLAIEKFSFPKIYELTDFPYFLPDLLEDEFPIQKLEAEKA